MKKVTLLRPAPPARKDYYVRQRHAVNSGNSKFRGEVPPSIEGVYPPGGIGGKVKEKEKPSVSLADLLTLAEQLPNAERKTLLAQLALKAQSSDGGQDRDKDMWAQAVYEALARAFEHEGGAGQGPALVKRSVSVPAAWAPVADFMASSKLDDLTVTERQSVYGLVAQLVVQNARSIARRVNAPLSAKLVASCASNVASLFDNAFPGYLAAGLAPIVAKQLTSARP